MISIDFVSCRLIRDRSIKYKCSNPADVVKAVIEICKNEIGDADREYAIVFSLDAQNVVLNASVVSVGSVSTSIVHPREVFKTAIISNASKIILVHNHPTGNVLPSGTDVSLVNKLKQSGEILCIPLVDAIIVSDEEYYSFLEHDLI